MATASSKGKRAGKRPRRGPSRADARSTVPGAPSPLDDVPIWQALDQLEDANARAANEKACENWCPPSAAARLVTEVRMLRAALITIAPAHHLLADDRVLGRR